MATRRIGIELVADYNGEGVKIGTADLREFQLMSERAVASAERLTSKATNLRQVAQANRQLAASATEGSDAWRIYTAQADKADAALARLMGTSKASGAAAAASAAGTAELSAEMRTVERDANKMSRGLLAGTGALSGMGRSLAFASTMFIGTAGLSAAIKGSVDQGEQFARDQASLSTAIRKTGGSVSDLLPQINEWATKQADLGVSITGSETALARMIELVGNTKQAVSAYEMALAISKATGMDFQAVSLATGKAMEGQTQALARYIGKIPASMTQQELYNAVMKKYGGQAEANTVASDKLRASVSNIETEVGTALLPTVDRYLNKASAWLDNSENQKRVADDVKTAMDDLGSVVNKVGGIIHYVDGITGSFTHTMEILLGLKVADTLSGWGNSLYKVAGAEATASAEAKGLMGWLSGLAKIGPILIPVGIAYFVEKYGAKNALDAGSIGTFTKSLGPDVAKDQTITVGGKAYPIGTSVAVNALRNAGAKGPLDTAAQQVHAAKSLGGTSSLTDAAVSKLEALAKTLADQGKAVVNVPAAAVPSLGGGGSGLGTTPLGGPSKGKGKSKSKRMPTPCHLIPFASRPLAGASR